LDEIGIYPKIVNKAKPKAFLVLGSSGSGKGTQSKKIADKFGFIHICTGDLLRK
jgi:cytidylate kinase